MENKKIGLLMLGIETLFLGMYLYINALPKAPYVEPERNYQIEIEQKPEIEAETIILKMEENEEAIETLQTETETEVETETEPETLSENEVPVYTIEKLSKITLDDFYKICRVVMNEAGGESYKCQVAVAETIINRINSDKFPDTIYEVLYQPYQYSHADNGEITDSVKEAVTQALEQHIYDTDMMYFREDYYHEFAEDYFYINNMYFSRCYKLENGEFVEVE